jgi:hypothetical protein
MDKDLKAVVKAAVEQGWRVQEIADGLVELADAREAGGEGDVTEGKLRRFDEHPGGLRPLGTCQSERRRKKGWMLQSPDPTQGSVAIHKTPSDVRAIHKTIAQLRRRGLRWPPE